jgi:signal transduction histidine kinase
VALQNVLLAWAVAGLLAVLVAAGAGVAMASRITRPIERLTAAADRMAEGELGARTGLRRAAELGRLAASFDSMAGRLEETVTALRRFVADAAHEIGTPLTALQADLDLAAEKAASDDERRLIDRAMTQSERLGELTRDLLGLSRLEASDGDELRDLVELGSLVRHVAEAFESRAHQAGVTLAVAGTARVAVTGSGERLRVAVEHLVENAIKFTPGGGAVTIGVEAASATVTVWVQDTGVGIPADELPHVFERFRRGRGVGDRPGSGLGLAIVRATAERHGGSVLATSGPGGSRFELRLPVA